MAVKAQCGGVMLGETMQNLNGAIEVKPMANQAASTAEDSPTTAEFNALLTKLKAAGLMIAD